MATARPVGTDLTSPDISGKLTQADYTLPVNQESVVQRRVASGQITITDLNDGRMIQSYTTASLGDTQVYKPDTKTYTPDYAAEGAPLVVTAAVFMSGHGSDLAATSACTGWAWQVNGKALESWAVASSNKLTIKRNIPTSDPHMTVSWKCTCTDSQTGASIPVEGTKTITLVQSVGATGLVVIELPQGATFGTGGPQSLTAKARLMRGSTHDKTVTTAAWEALDIATASWKSVTKGVKALSGGVSEIAVEAADVLNFQTYRCTITDTESGEAFTGQVTFLDASDPYMVELYTLTGDVIKNGEGTTTIYARLWRSGEVVENGESKLYNYGFAKFNKDGQATAWTDTAGTILNGVVKFGNPVTVQAADVTGRATFYCNVTKKQG